MTTRMILRYYLDLDQYRWELFTESGLIARCDTHSAVISMRKMDHGGWYLKLDEDEFFVDELDYQGVITLDDAFILSMIDEGYDTVPRMTCRALGLPLIAPSKLSDEGYLEYMRAKRQISARLKRMEKCHEVAFVYDEYGKTRIWRRIQ